MINADSLRLVVLRGDEQGANKALYRNAFGLWRSVWEQTFQELENATSTPSDDFTRQHEILCLFQGDQCVALICHRYAETDNPAIWSDSYFRPWSREAKEALKVGARLVIGSQITIHPEYRGRSKGFSLKELIAHCSLTHLDRQNVDAITGVMRADKAMNTLFYTCGARPLARGLTFHNVQVDLVGFFPKIHPIRIPDTYVHLVNDLLPDTRIKAKTA